MPIVSNVAGSLIVNANFAEVVTAGILGQTVGGGSLSYPVSILSQLGQMLNGNGAAFTCDLCYGKQLTLAAAATLLDFSALADPAGTTQNWTGGRVRLFAVQVLTTTANFDVSVYADTTNGWAQVPPVANTLKARANGGIILLFDPNSNGAGNGMVVTSSSKRFNLDPGANTVVVNAIAIGSSVA